MLRSDYRFSLKDEAPTLLDELQAKSSCIGRTRAFQDDIYTTVPRKPLDVVHGIGLGDVYCAIGTQFSADFQPGSIGGGARQDDLAP